jgi:Phage integrase, N-terminal SAM-like domain
VVRDSGNRKAWVPPEADQTPAPKLTLQTYADRWLEHRDLKPRTYEHYRVLLDDHILPKLGARPIASITADDVRDWHVKLGNSRSASNSSARRLDCWPPSSLAN